MRLTATLALAFLIGLAAPAVARQPPAAERPPLELPRLAGTWYVIARIPNPVERGHVASRDEYTLRDNNSLGIRYVYREGFGEPEQEKTARASVDEAKVIGSPSSRISPDVGATTPERTFISVDLPAPFSPKSVVTWPRWMSKFTPFKAWMLP